MQSDRHPRSAAMPVQSSRYYACVVENQNVSALQQLGQVVYDMVGQGIIVHMQQPCGVTRLGRTLSDPRWRQLEIEQIDAHEN
jgi:hypothetical protein